MQAVFDEYKEVYLFHTASRSSSNRLTNFSPSSIQLNVSQVETNYNMKTLRTGGSCLSVFIERVLETD